MPVTFATTEHPLAKYQPTSMNRLLPVAASDGGVRVVTVKYTTTTGTDEAANDIINLIDLPVGSIVIPQMSSVGTLADVGTSVIIDIGYAANTDAFADGIDISAVGNVMFCSGTFPSGASVPEPITTTTVYATVMTATSPTASVVVTFTIAYRLPNT